MIHGWPCSAKKLASEGKLKFHVGPHKRGLHDSEPRTWQYDLSPLLFFVFFCVPLQLARHSPAAARRRLALLRLFRFNISDRPHLRPFAVGLCLGVYS